MGKADNKRNQQFLIFEYNAIKFILINAKNGTT